ncbi:hypothetical protein E4U19_000909 [Claviceps sp. Clav32 group G5]|nr:hypothetical protein E4U19_000909 [Claviceps sp. Clav32 group G5]
MTKFIKARGQDQVELHRLREDDAQQPPDSRLQTQEPVRRPRKPPSGQQPAASIVAESRDVRLGRRPGSSADVWQCWAGGKYLQGAVRGTIYKDEEDLGAKIASASQIHAHLSRNPYAQ